MSNMTKNILIGWSAVYLLLALISTWLTTGQHALGGPSTIGEDLVSFAWLGFSLVQLVVAVALLNHYKPWLSRTAMALATLSVGSLLIGPALTLLGVS
jgi:hypothetical protein